MAYFTIGNGDTGLLFSGSGDYITPRNPTTQAGRDAAIDLGTGSDRFKDLYLSGSAHIGGNIIPTGGSATAGSIWKSGANLLISMDTGGLYVNNSADTSTAFHITDAGNVEIGTTAIANSQTSAVLSVRHAGPSIEFGHNNQAGYASTIGANSSNGHPYVAFSAEPATTTANAFRTRGLKGTVLSGTATGDMTFSRVPLANADDQVLVESMRIDASGNLLVGASSQLSSSKVLVSFNGTSHNGIVLKTTRAQTGSSFEVYLNSSNQVAGSISHNGSTTVSYNTSSDQRLKENIADADDAGSKIDAIQVRKFDWKADGSHQDYGMVAQELQAVAPEAVSGDADSEEMMGVDYSKLVPMMLKEIQSLRARVAQLES